MCVNLTGIESSEEFGALLIEATADIALTGIESQEAFGDLTVYNNSFSYEASGGVRLGAVPHTGAVVSIAYNDVTSCSNKLRCEKITPNRHFDCFSPGLFYPDRRKFMPKSMKGTVGVLPAITVCNQQLYLPKN